MDSVAQNVEKLKSEFGDRAFSGRDVARVLGKDAHGTGGIFKYMLARREILRIKSGAYQFLATKAPAAENADPAQPSIGFIAPTPVVTSEPLCSPSPLVRIGDLYLHERMLLIADVARQMDATTQAASAAVRLYTTIIEVDPATKHPRNKIVNFTKSRDPKEYALTLAWIDSMAGVPSQAVDETALELAAEHEKKLNTANQEIAELKAKLESIRGMLRGEL